MRFKRVPMETRQISGRHQTAEDFAETRATVPCPLVGYHLPLSHRGLPDLGKTGAFANYSRSRAIDSALATLCKHYVSTRSAPRL